MTEEELAQLAAQHGGERSRTPDPKTVTIKSTNKFGQPADVPNPNPTYVITFGDNQTIHVVGDRDPTTGQATGTLSQVEGGTLKGTTASTARGTEGGAPYIERGKRYDPVTQTFVPISGYEPTPVRAPIQSSSGTWWQQGEDGEMHMIGANPIEIQNQQQQANERAATAQRAQDAERRQGVQTQLNVIKAAQDAGEIDAKRAQELRDWLYKTQVEAPAKQLEQQDVLLGKGIERGRLAGEAAVSDITATLPYRYSPGFDARQTAVAREASRGNFLPGMYQSIARSYTGTDLRAARTGAETQYQNQYLTEFGFDQPAAPQAGYRVPSAGGAPPGAVPAVAAADVVDPDEEAIKALARQMAGG